MRSKLDEKVSRTFLRSISILVPVGGNLALVCARVCFLDGEVQVSWKRADAEPGSVAGRRPKQEVDVFQIVGVASVHPERQDVSANAIIVLDIVEPIFQNHD